MGNNEEAGNIPGPDLDRGVLDGRYQLGPILGRGAMSTVYRATDLLLGRDVAIKIFLPGSGDESFRARQETEMRLLASFDHPALVAAFDTGVDTRNDEERAYFVMELAEGRDLRAVLADGPLPVWEAANIGFRIAEALSEVHARGVIHRDIKPANILVSGGDVHTQSVKLADFGVALVMNDNRLTATGFTVGTAQYLSPEQAQGLHLTPASDIYSLGLVILETLTGKAEYPGTPVETATARLHRSPHIPPELPRSLRSLLAAMTDMDPLKRPGAHEVEQSLAVERTRPGRPAAVVASLPPMPSRPPLAVRTRRQSAVAGALSLGRRRPKTLRGVAAAAVTVPLALLMFVQGLAPSANIPPAQRADVNVSQADPQTSAPADPAGQGSTQPVEAVPTAAPVAVPTSEGVPASTVDLPAAAQLPAPAPVTPAAPAVVGSTNQPGGNAKDSGSGKQTKPQKAKDKSRQNGPGK